eukprot:GCRY01002313.1.p1 GENE.GCRY01002313.1~~GCRY01002313.1.p1  ORF type:complete len:192 (+),score=43.66 GCRY01002313.1:43-618(+)
MDSDEKQFGIPKALFIEDLEKYMNEKDVETTMSELQDLYNKYKFFEAKLLQEKKVLKVKVPEIKKTLDVVNHLLNTKDQEERVVNYELTNSVYAKATIEEGSDTIGLWLGGNTMVEYTYDEAKQFLEKNLDTATRNLENTSKELEFLKEQITTMEVNIARVYNFDVKRKRAQQQVEGASSSSTTPAEAASS